MLWLLENSLFLLVSPGERRACWEPRTCKAVFQRSTITKRGFVLSEWWWSVFVFLKDITYLSMCRGECRVEVGILERRSLSLESRTAQLIVRGKKVFLQCLNTHKTVSLSTELPSPQNNPQTNVVLILHPITDTYLYAGNFNNLISAALFLFFCLSLLALLSPSIGGFLHLLS